METLTIEDVRNAVKEAIAQVNRQKTVYIQDLKHPDLELLKPLPVFLEFDAHTVIANYYDTESFGYGDSEYEALNDLCAEIAQTYLDLAEDPQSLGQLPARWWAHLQTVIRRRTDATQTP